MSVIHIAVPVLKGRSVFTIDKGRAWSAVEHALLEALARRKWTSAELSGASNLPRRVIVEVLTRLMRAGWVELTQSEGALQFGATARGRVASEGSELPAILQRMSKPISYVIDLVAGDVFRKKDWVIHTGGTLHELFGSRCIRIEPTSPDSALDPNEIVSALLDDDETFVNAERSGTTRRYGLVTVRDGVIEGLPSGRDLAVLKAAIHSAAAAYPSLLHLQSAPSFSPPSPAYIDQEAKEFKLRASPDDLILDGIAHRNELVSVLRDARSVAVIHSTFISAERFFDVFEHVKSAVERGVRVHILWGQNEELENLVSSQTAIAQIRANPEVMSLGGNLTIHSFSTGSHAKFLIADTGTRGGYVAVIGSCNWLTSGFNSYDVSVRLRDPEIVLELVRVLSSLVPVRDGDWTRFSTELIHLGRKVATSPRRSGQNSRGCVVIGSQHSRYVLRARDEARSTVLVASHRLGPVSNPSVLVPFSTAVRARGISADVFYARTQAPVNRASETLITGSASEAGVAVRSVRKPRIHAKLLAWDNDNILVTSLNWLSADPVGVANAKEVGIWLQSPGIARSLKEDFYRAMELDGNDFDEGGRRL